VGDGKRDVNPGDRVVIGRTRSGTLVGWPFDSRGAPAHSRILLARTLTGALVGWPAADFGIPAGRRVVLGRTDTGVLVTWASTPGRVCFTVPHVYQLVPNGMFTMNDGAQVVFWRSSARSGYVSAWGYAIKQAGATTWDEPVGVVLDTDLATIVRMGTPAWLYKRSGDSIFAVIHRDLSDTERLLRFDYAGGAISVTEGPALLVSATDGRTTQFHVDDANGLVHLWLTKRTGDGSAGNPYQWHGSLIAADQTTLASVYTLSGVAALDPIDPIEWYDIYPTQPTLPPTRDAGNAILNALTAMSGGGSEFFLCSQQERQMVKHNQFSTFWFAELYGLPTPKISRVVAGPASYSVTTQEGGIPGDPLPATPHSTILVILASLRASWDGNLLVFSGPYYEGLQPQPVESFARTRILGRSGADSYSGWVGVWLGIGLSTDLFPGAVDNCVQSGGRVDLVMSDGGYNSVMTLGRVGGTWETSPSSNDPGFLADTVLAPDDLNVLGASWFAYNMLDTEYESFICTTTVSP
jgi:hypothetical protein